MRKCLVSFAIAFALAACASSANAQKAAPIRIENYELWHYEFLDVATCLEAYKIVQKDADGVIAFPPFKQFLDVYVKAGSSATKNKLDGLKGAWADYRARHSLPPRIEPPEGTPVRGDPGEHVLFGGYKGLTGKDVIVAVIDSGLDFRNVDFQTPDGKTRLLYFWDLGSPGRELFRVTGTLDGKEPLHKTRMQPHRVHSTKLLKGRTYQIDLISRDTAKFDPYLILEDADGKKLDENDDIDVNTNRNSRLYRTAPADETVRLIVTRYEAGSGPYYVRVADVTPGVAGKTPLYPNQTPMGMLYDRAEINNALAGKGPGITGDPWDVITRGHGTGCMTIAAGAGRVSKEVGGVAPAADLIAVRIADEAGRLPHADSLNPICAWLLETAHNLKKPIVISCSFGSSLSGLDGNLIQDRQLSAHFPVDGPGQALCVSAGNEAYGRRHAMVVLDGKGTKQKLRWMAPTGGTMTLRFDTDSVKNIDVEGRYRQSVLDNLAYNPITKAVQTKTHDRHWLSVRNSNSEDVDELIVSSGAGKPITMHAEFFGSGKFFAPHATPYWTVKTPGRAASAICVGSYDWNNRFQNRLLAVQTGPGIFDDMNLGGLSAYSSRGPAKGSFIPDVSKPDIVAPGQYFSVNFPQQYSWSAPSGRLDYFNGTSAATPYTAGVIALMMEAKPDITTKEIRQLFKAHATDDLFTGKRSNLPNGDWGYGKLDRAAVQRMLDQLIAQRKAK